jgi:hypothetical protein
LKNGYSKIKVMIEEEKKKHIHRVIWLVKLGMIGFGYLILSMFQHTINPIEFHWLATVLFFGWVMLWLSTKANIIK